MKKYNWNVLQNNTENLEQYAQEFGGVLNKKVSLTFTTLLLNRGIDSAEKLNKFLNPEKYLDGEKLPDIEKAISRIKQAITENEKIIIYGDYDVDGTCGTAILYKNLKKLKADVQYFLPDRQTHGYGLNKNVIQSAANQGVKLLITVDCGTTDLANVNLANSLAMQVIITDHHLLKENLPSAVAVVNPKRLEPTSPIFNLSGSGVAYFLCRELLNQNEVEGLDLVAIATVADVVDLTGANRYLVKRGLEEIKKNKNLGLASLIDCSGLKNIEEISSTYHLPFIISPRINAPGRLSTPDISLELLLTNEEEKAKELAYKIELLNKERQKLQEKIFLQAKLYIAKEINLDDEKIIVLGERKWNRGVIGIVAQKLVEEFGRPVVLMELPEDDLSDALAVGSCRSIYGFSICDALNHCSEILESFGGHNMAAGVSVKPENILNLRKKINDFAKNFLTEDNLIPSLNIDTCLNLKDINFSLWYEICKLEPCGRGNSVPVFAFNNLFVEDVKWVGGGQVLKLKLNQNGCSLNAVSFYQSNIKISKGDKVNIAASLSLNNWNGNKNLELKIKDLKIN